MKRKLLLSTLILISSLFSFGAVVTENFDTFSSSPSGYSNYMVNGWQIIDGFSESTNIYGTSGHAVRLDDDFGAAVISPAKTNGIGTISFWYRSWDADTIHFLVQTSTDGSTWNTIDSVRFTNTTYANYTNVANSPFGKYVRVISGGQERLLIDEFFISDACPSPIVSNTTKNICEGESFTFRGTTYSTTGMYTDTVFNAIGCHINYYNLTLNVQSVLRDTTNVYVCDGSTISIVFHGKTYDTIGIYSDTTLNVYGCPQEIYTLNVSDYPVVLRDTVDQSICFGTSFTFLGKTYNTTGVYSDTTKNSTGCDSLIESINLTVEAEVLRDTTVSLICSGDSMMLGSTYYKATGIYSDTLYSGIGCDSAISVLDLTVYAPSIVDTITETICGGTSKLFHGSTYSISGTYSDTLQSINGCDSAIHTINLTVRPLLRDTLNATICDGASEMFRGNGYTMAGFYSDTLQSVIGCDSAIHSLNLTVQTTTNDTLVQAICNGDSILFGGNYYKTTGFYRDTMRSTLGCDSAIMNLDLTAVTLTVLRDTINETICGNETKMFYGTTYSTAGTYSDTVLSILGCDSAIHTMNLTILSLDRDTISSSICEGTSELFRGVNYSITGIYSDTVKNAMGCDSAIHSLDLTVNNIVRDSSNVTICIGDSLMIGSSYYKVAGTYSDTNTSVITGCDSIDVINMSIQAPVVRDTISVKICEGMVMPFGSMSYTTTGLYADTVLAVSGCDSLIHYLDLTVEPVTIDTTTLVICGGSSTDFYGTTYTTSGMYTKIFTSAYGCDSAIHRLDLTVRPLIRDTVSFVICEFSNVNFHGISYYTTGIYSDTLKSIIGCDSIIRNLDLTVHPALVIDTVVKSICYGTYEIFGGDTLRTDGFYRDTIMSSIGCDSLINNLDLTIQPLVERDTISETICFGTSTTFYGMTYDETGFYSDTVKSLIGCDSLIHTLNLTESPILRDTIQDVICQNETRIFGSMTLNLQGVYSDTMKNANGCDSISVLELTVNTVYRDTIYRFNCNGDSTLLGNTYYKSTGLYIDTNQSILGCDSIDIMYLTVPVYVNPVQTSVSCDDFRLPDGRMVNISGTYRSVLTSSTGCDSVITSAVTINYTKQTTMSATVCNSYTSPSGKTFTNTGSYYDTIPTVSGCDSLFVINLTVNVSTSETRTITACTDYTVPETGVTYSTSGTYNDVINNAAGCTHTITTVLTINPVVASNITLTGATLSSTATGVSYKWLDCDNNFSFILGETNQSFSPTRNGNYACWITTAQGCSDTSSCMAVNNTSLEGYVMDENEVVIYPNPATENLTIEILNQNINEKVSIRMFDAVGKLVYSNNSVTNENKLQLNVSNFNEGIYTVIVNNENFVINKKVVITK